MTVYVILDAQEKIVAASLNEDTANEYAAPIRGYRVVPVNLMDKEIEWV